LLMYNTNAVRQGMQVIIRHAISFLGGQRY
jgi:hypothetical protein